MKMQTVLFSALFSAFICVVVNGHVVNYDNNSNNNNNTNSNSNSNTSRESNNVVFNSTEVDDNDNSTDITNTTMTTEAPEENRVFRIRERNRRYRLRRIREQILQSLGWTEPPKIPESVRRRVLNNTYPLLSLEPEVREDRRCFSASCVLPRQIDRNLWESSEERGFRVFTNIPSRQELSRSTLETADLKVYLTHIEGYTCHGDEVPISRTGSRFLVQVYQFMRPLRFQRSRNRVLNRKRLLDARMVTTSGDTWITFDVKQAVSEWVTGVRNNFGFEIMVKDENETECNAMEMFVTADCQSPPETGCREENTQPIMPRLPWIGEITDNYPYLELVSRERRPHHGSRRRFSRSVGSRSSRHDARPASSREISSRNDAVRAALRDVSGTRSRTMSPSLEDIRAMAVPFNRETTVGFCQGREVRIDIWESAEFVIAPRYYTTLVCSGTCASTYNGMLQIAATRCRAVQRRRVMGLYFDDNHQVIIGELPYTQVVQCGC